MNNKLPAIFCSHLYYESCKKFKLPNIRSFFIYNINESNFINIDNINLNYYEKSVLSVLDDERKYKISKYNKDVAVKMFAGDVISRFAINYIFGIDIKKLFYKTDNSGKPYLKDYRDVFFNISHSKNAVVCAVSDKKVGVDVQYMKDVNFKYIIKRCFSEKEKIKISNSIDKKNEFYNIWTQKESFIKCNGSKISHGMKYLNYKENTLKNFDIFNYKYKGCICTEK